MHLSRHSVIRSLIQLTKRHILPLKLNALAVLIRALQAIYCFRERYFPLRGSNGGVARGAGAGSEGFSEAGVGLKHCGEGERDADLRAEMLEESGDDGQAADDDPDRQLGVGPDAE